VSWLADPLTTLAFCWRLERRDGVALGFTGHDRDLFIDGLTYRAAPGMTPSAISLTDAFDVDTLDIAGALTDDAITDADLAAGRWDGAAVTLFATDWRDTTQRLPLTRGTLGQVGVKDGAFTAELSGPTAILDAPVTEATSPDCRAMLGDARCRVDLAPRTRFARLVAADGPMLTLDTGEPTANAYGQGRLWWVDGANSGLVSLIAASAGTGLTLREPPPFAAEPGTRVRLTEGCDRTIATCAARFNNAVNFRGEPYLPGNDLLTRYPGA
jgi:uncharacterized phage protein (TIGR02218 family)